MRALGSAGIAMGAVATIMVTGCGSAVSAPPSTEAVATEVKAAIHKQVDAYASRDQATIASILAPDVKTFFHGEPDVVGKAAAEASIKGQLALPSFKLQVSDETVDVAASGDLAVYHAKYRFSFTNPQTKMPFVEVGNWVAIFKRQPDGVMQLRTDIIADRPAD